MLSGAMDDGFAEDEVVVGWGGYSLDAVCPFSPGLVLRCLRNLWLSSLVCQTLSRHTVSSKYLPSMFELVFGILPPKDDKISMRVNLK